MRLAIGLAIETAPLVTRACATNGCDFSAASNVVARWYGELIDPNSDPDQLSAQMSADLGPEGGSVAVTDFEAPFELRKLQWRWSRIPAGANPEDVDVCTFHWLKVSGSTPAPWVDGTDLPVLEGLVDAFWTSILANYPAETISHEYRWYKDGPAFYSLTPPDTSYKP